MTSRRLLAALLVPVVLATGIAAAVHAHLPRWEARTGVATDTGASVHDAGSCPVCRLAQESAPVALPMATLGEPVASWTIGDAAEPVPLATAVDLAGPPRAPPVLPLV